MYLFLVSKNFFSLSLSLSISLISTFLFLSLSLSIKFTNNLHLFKSTSMQWYDRCLKSCIYFYLWKKYMHFNFFCSLSCFWFEVNAKNMMCLINDVLSPLCTSQEHILLFVWNQEQSQNYRQGPDYPSDTVTAARCENWPPVYICLPAS